jgi:HEPN domain-containing protein
MTRQEIVVHWKHGARASLRLSELAHGEQEYALALFHAHLAVEKALKAVYILTKEGAPPPTHDLLLLASRLEQRWNPEDEEALAHLTEYAVTARYDDIEWSRHEATQQNSGHWISQAKHFLSLLDA